MAEPFDPYHQWLGIGPADRPVSLYRLLGLEPCEGDREAIAAAVERQSALVRARDAGPYVAIAKQVLSQIESARRTLLDPAAKSAYDAKLRARSVAPAQSAVGKKLVRARALDEPPPPPPPAATGRPVAVGNAPADYSFLDEPLPRNRQTPTPAAHPTAGRSGPVDPVDPADDVARNRARAKRKNLLVTGGLVAAVGTLVIVGIVLIVIRLKPKATAEHADEDRRPPREPLAAEDFLPADQPAQTATSANAAAERSVAERSTANPPTKTAATKTRVSPPSTLAAESSTASPASADLAKLIAADADPAELRAAVESGGNLETTDANGRTPLRLAVMLGRAALVQTLIELRADVNAADPLGETPLMSAAQRGDVAIVETLLAARAKVDAKTKAGLTPLLVAAHHGQADVVQALAAAHANLNQGNRSGATPLMAAARAGQHAVVCTLLEAGAKVDAVDVQGQTALMYAAAGGRPDTIDVLLDHGAQLRAKNQRGATALSIALGAENAAWARRLRDAGRDLAPDLNDLE